MTYAGGCLCGQIKFRIDGPLRPVIACHCRQCRKTSGHHVAATAANRAHVEVTGDVTWFVSSDIAKRGFCATCGSNLFYSHNASDNLSIFAGVIDGDTGLRIAGHIYCADKGDYYDITDDAPRADGFDPNLTTT